MVDETKLSEYEKQALVEVRKHKKDVLNKSPRRLVSEERSAALRERGKAVADRARSLPGADAAFSKAQQGYVAAVSGLGKATINSSKLTLSEGRMLHAYTRRGHEVNELADIRSLDLKIVEKHVRPKWMDAAYATTAAIEGGATGFVISGGEALASAGTVFGAGAGGAPGLGTVTTAMAADATFTLIACSRVVAHTAMYYGYDPLDRGEELFMMGVLNLGTAGTAGAKMVAYSELSKLAQGLARRAAWAKLNEQVLPRVAQAFATRIGLRLTQRKLGTLVPIVGILAGAGLNYRLLDSVAEAAYWSYRERFITEKMGGDAVLIVPERTPDSDTSDDDAISVLGILEQERSGFDTEPAKNGEVV